MKSFNSYGALLSRPNLLKELDGELGARSLREFVLQAWSIVEPSTPLVPGWHIDAIIEHLEAVTRGEIRNLLINVPPRHMKSLLVSVFWPAWEWIRFPHRRWLYSSYAASLSMRDSIKCRRLIDSPWYQSLWSHRFQLTGDQNTKTRFDNDKGGYRLSTSVGGAATGEGGDRVVCDDPHNVQEALSDSIRHSTTDWFDVVMSTRLNDPKSSAKVVVMQRCHERDLSGHLLVQGGWDHLCLPAEYEGTSKTTSIGWRDPRVLPGELLWQQRFGSNELAALKRSLGSYASAGQLQQRPSPAAGGLLKRHWFRFWHPESLENPRPITVTLPDGGQRTIVSVELRHADAFFQSWDCSFKDLDTSDYVVGQLWGKKGPNYVLIEQVRAKMDLPGTVKAIRQMSAKWPESYGKFVEDKANGSAVIQMLQREIAGLIPVNPEGGKVARASAISPLIEAGNVYLPHPDVFPWVQDFIEECAMFPNGAHDDQVDAMTQLILNVPTFEEQYWVWTAENEAAYQAAVREFRISAI